MSAEPARRASVRRRPRRFVIGRVEDFPEGSTTVVDVGGRSIGVFRFGGRLSALLNRCPHQGGPLCEGVTSPLVSSDVVGDITVDFDKTLVTCPWHGWEFDVVDGQSYCDPNRFRVKPYSVDVAKGSSVREELETGETGSGGRQLVEGPYKAEVVPIEIDDDYVVVQMR